VDRNRQRKGQIHRQSHIRSRGPHACAVGRRSGTGAGHIKDDRSVLATRHLLPARTEPIATTGTREELIDRAQNQDSMIASTRLPCAQETSSTYLEQC
jgi:hypothetical protein